MAREQDKTDFADDARVILRVLDPGKPTKEFRLGPGRYQIGRARDCDVALRETSVSRKHFEIAVKDDGRVVGRDLGSTTGSFLDGRRVQGIIEIPPGAALSLGEQRLQLVEVPRRLVDSFGGATARSKSGAITVVGDDYGSTLYGGPAGMSGGTLPDGPLGMGGGTLPDGPLGLGGGTMPGGPVAMGVDTQISGPQIISSQQLPAMLPSASIDVSIGTMVDGWNEQSQSSAPKVFRSRALSALGAAPTEADLADAEKHSVLSDLPEVDRAELLRTARRVVLPPGSYITRVGEEVDALHIVLGGEVQLMVGERSVGTVPNGGAVELRGVILQRRAEASAICEETVTVLRVDAQKLREAIARHPQVEAFLRRVLEWPGAERLRDIMLEYAVERSVQVEVIAGLWRRKLKSGTKLNQDGEPATALWILDKGTIAGWKVMEGERALVLELTVGAVFGGAEVLAERPLTLAFETTSEAELLELDGEIVRRLVEHAPELRRLFEAMGPFGKEKAPEPEPIPEESPPDDDADAPPVSTFKKAGGNKPMRRPRRYHIRQHDEMDCGAACLSMVANSYGRKLSLAYYRSLVHVTREGASMWSLVQAARRTGFQVCGIQASVKALAGLFLPALLLFQYHYVVVYAINDKFATVADPAIGLRQIPIDEFKKSWSGMALLFRPTAALYQHPESASGLLKYRVMLRGIVRPIFEILGASLLLFGFGLFTPLVTQIVFDKVLVQNDKTLLNLLMIGVGVVVGFQQIGTAVRSYLTAFVANKFDSKFSALVYRHVLKLPLNYFMVRRVGDFLTRLREIAKIRQFLTGDSLTSVIQVISIAIYVSVLFLYDRRLGVATLLLVPLIVATSLITAGRLERILQEGFPARAKSQGLIVEQVRALDTIKALGAELPSRWRWEEALRETLRNTFRVDRLRVLTSTISSGIEQFATTAMTFYAASLCLRGQLSVGKVIATGQFVASIFAPVKELAGRFTSLQETSVALGRVDDIITATAEPGDDVRPPEGQRLAGDIEFRNVWFQYGSDLSPWVLKNINLTIKRGETVAFVGRSGSGKTTLVQLINLLYRPTRGEIFIDGKNVAEMPLRLLRDSVGIVMQDSNLFAGSIFENITFGDDRGSIDLAMAASRVANAHGFISKLKNGYQAKLDEGGRSLSGGQRQRVNIARALYRRPSILILDEATSALDSESERAVVDAMKVFCRGRTSIVIAHRLSTILHADRIVLLDNGRMIETGSHRELIRKGGAYSQLFGAQLAI